MFRPRIIHWVLALLALAGLGWFVLGSAVYLLFTLR